MKEPTLLFQNKNHQIREDRKKIEFYNFSPLSLLKILDLVVLQSKYHPLIM